MKVHIAIETRTFVRFVMVVLGFGVAILAAYSARHALIILGLSFFFAMALNRPVSLLAKHLPGNSRIGGTAIAYIFVVAFIGIFLFLVVPPVIQQSSKFVDTIPSLTQNATTQYQLFGDVVDKYNLQPQVDKVVQEAQSSVTSFAGNIVSGFTSFISFIASVFLVLVLSFLMLVEAPIWLERFWRLYNDKERRDYHKKLAGRMYNVVSGYVTGQLAVTTIGAAVAGLVVFVLSFIFPAVPANLTLPAAAIAFVLSLIPMFGATISGVIITLLLLLNDVYAGGVFGVFFILYQQFENNFIAPVIQAKTVELSALAVLASVTIGLYVFGIVGGIISIPIAGSIKVLAEDYLERAKTQRKQADKPLAKLAKKLHHES